MLINIEPGRETVTKIEGQAHIVISLDIVGAASMKAFFMGRHNSTFSNIYDTRMLEWVLPKMLGKLRSTLAFEPVMCEP